MRSKFVPSDDASPQGGGRSTVKRKPKDVTKFSASVKQAWKTKKIVSRMRRKSLTQPTPSRLAARRTGIMGLGLPGFMLGGGGGGNWTAGNGESGHAHTGYTYVM